jgi:hypothetical protein
VPETLHGIPGTLVIRPAIRVFRASIKTKTAVPLWDEWTSAAGISSGRLLRRLSRCARILGNLSDWGVWHVVVTSARVIGIQDFGPTTCVARQRGSVRTVAEVWMNCGTSSAMRPF